MPPTAARPEVVAHVRSELEKNIVYWAIKRALKDEILKPEYEAASLPSMLPQVMDRLHLTARLRSAVYDVLEPDRMAAESRAHEPRGGQLPEPAAPTAGGAAGGAAGGSSGPVLESLPGMGWADHQAEHITRARRAWDANLAKRMNSISAERRLPWASPRPADQGVAPYRNQPFLMPVQPHELLDHLAAIKNKNRRGLDAQFLSWGRIQLQIGTPDITELRVLFRELDPSHRQVGLDDATSGRFAKMVVDLGNKLLAEGHPPDLAQYAKCGVPTNLRGAVWHTLLRVEPSREEANYFAALRKQAGSYELLTDRLVWEAIRTGACNNDNYFIFEALVEQMLVTMSRDPYVRKHAQSQPHMPFLVAPNAGASTPRGTQYPPSGIIPYSCMVSWVAPLCYIYDEPHHLYHAWRAWYTRYCCRLHSIDDHPQSILSLCKLFEDLAHAVEPETCFHLERLGVPAVDVAFNWISNAFTGYLEVSELLLLWDRVLGFDDLRLFSVLAAAVLSWRSKDLLVCQSKAEIVECLGDLSHLEVSILLTTFMFKI